MKEFRRVVYDPIKVRKELGYFKRLLDAKETLSERHDIQPFFKKHEQLSSFIATFDARIGPGSQLAFEFPFFGDFAADLIVGNRDHGGFLVVEFEDGHPDSVFTKLKNKATREWGRRFDHGFSQLVDWFYCLDDFKKTARFAAEFGHGHVVFSGLLVVGRSADLHDRDRARLNWRSEKVRVDSHTIDCVTFDALYEFLKLRIGFYPEAFKAESH